MMRSSVLSLPPPVRAWLDAELRRNGYSEFVRLERELLERGHRISNSALHRYSLALRRLDGVPLRGGGWDLRPIKATDPPKPAPAPPAPAPPPQPTATRDQRAAVKNWLASGRKLNARQAIEHFGCYRLAAVIERIRRIDGWPIETIKAPGSGFATYRLSRDYNPFNSE